VAVALDAGTIGRARPEVEHERQVAIADLLHDNVFALETGPEGPYRLLLGLAGERLSLEIQDETGVPLTTLQLALGPFQRLIRDYFLICDSYYEAIRTAPPSRIEAIDMGRRGLHNEASELLRARLAGKIETDSDTSRRLFTLICALHYRG
jgi:uncharacterized protein (UPF0262 family)